MTVVCCITLAGFVCGCLSDSLADKRITRYRPQVNDRGALPQQVISSPAIAVEAPHVQVPASLSKTLKRGDRISIELRGIPVPESIRAEIDDLGVNFNGLLAIP